MAEELSHLSLGSSLEALESLQDIALACDWFDPKQARVLADKSHNVAPATDECQVNQEDIGKRESHSSGSIARGEWVVKVHMKNSREVRAQVEIL